MKEVRSKRGIKQIIYIIVVLMLCNFIMPNYSYAVATEGGGSLVEVFAEFVCSIPDEVINYLQDMFVSPSDIKMSGENYRIRYSPGIIFAGEVPAFDINFINPKESKTVNDTKSYVSLGDITTGDFASIFSRLKNNKIDSSSFELRIGANPETIINRVNTDYYYNVRSYYSWVASLNYDEWVELGVIQEAEEFIMGSFKHNYVWVYENTIFFSVFHEVNYVVAHHMAYSVYSTTLTSNELQMLEEMSVNTEASKTYKSTTSILQDVVATWYNALRRIALVGLLSVLVYIGIRIVLSSNSAKDKAKYKKMLKDWLLALCMLFVLHYIMNITIIMVDKINGIIGASVVGEDGEDVLMSTVRNHIARGENWGSVLPYLVIYCTLGVYTIIFTIQYLRRVIYIAFLTMIAPLITLTYPLDKIKDSKSQAFDMWLKDYIFFSLLQVVHLLLYYILVGSSINLANQGNWLYAIAAIGFMTSAEKFMKKMFGFEKSKTMGALAAGATGALVMNVINKAKGVGGKGGASGGSAASNSGENSSGNVRTATTNPLIGLSTPGTMQTPDLVGNPRTSNQSTRNSSAGHQSAGSSNTSYQGAGDSGVSPQGTEDSGVSPQGTGISNKNRQSARNSSSSRQSIGNSSLSRQSVGNSEVGSQSTGNYNTRSQGIRFNNVRNTNNRSNSNTAESNKIKRNVLNGVAAVTGRYFAPAAKGALGTLLGGTGAIIGFSAGIAQGDAGKAFAGLVGGATAGTYLASNTVDTAQRLTKDIPEAAHSVADTWREGAYGEEYANNVKFDREFRNSNAYKELKRDSEFSDKEFDDKVQQMLDSGITDAKKMKKILKNHKKHPRKYNMDKAIAYSTMAEKCPNEILYSNTKFIRFCQDNNINISMEELENLRKCMIDFK